MFSFLKLSKIFKERFWNLFIDYIWLAERGKFINLISKEVENNKCYVKYIFWKVFKNSI